MRNLFFLLVIANVLFFGWQQYQKQQRSDGVSVIDPASLGEPVALIDDADDAAPPADDPAAIDAAPEQPANEVAATIGRACLSIGPFTEVGESQTELAALRAEGADVRQRAAQGRIFLGHFTFVENLPNRARAREVLATLKAGGLTEAYLIAADPGEDIIAIGLFSGRENAERAELQAKSMGIEARISERYREATVFWLDVRLGEAEQGGDYVENYGADLVLIGDAATCPNG